MLDLLLDAHQAATTSDQQDLLRGVMEDDDRLVRRIMEQNDEHADLMEDGFFVPFMGLAAARASRHVWQVLGDWGYSLQSRLYQNDDNPSQAQLDVGGWVARWLEPARLDELIKEKLLEPFAPSDCGLRHSPCELGMMGPEDELFDYWLGKWQDEIVRVRNENHNPRARANIPLGLHTMLGMRDYRRGHPDDCRPAWPALAQLEARCERMMDAFLGGHYGIENSPQERWDKFNAQPPVPHNKVSSLITLCVHASQRAPDRVASATPLVAVVQNSNWGLAAGLIAAGAPLDFNSPQGAAPTLLRLLMKARTSDANHAWGALMERARDEAPWLLAGLPGYLQRKGCDAGDWLRQDAARAERTLQAVALASCPPARATRPRRSL